jgi:hypothetical protein
MKIGDVYKLKEDLKTNDMLKFLLLSERIRIAYFSTDVNIDEFVIIAETFTDESMFYSAPSDCKHFKNEKEILKYYEPYMAAEEFHKYLQEIGVIAVC